MASSRRGSQPSGWLLLAVLVASLSLALLAATRVGLPRDRITVGAILVGTLLIVAALTVPALLFAGWQSERE